MSVQLAAIARFDGLLRTGGSLPSLIARRLSALVAEGFGDTI